MGVDRSALGKSNRRRGATFERDVASLYREAGHTDARRGIQNRTGADAADVEGTPYWVECKLSNVRAPNVHTAFEQGAADTDGREVAVWSRVARGRTLVTISSEHYLRLVAAKET